MKDGESARRWRGRVLRLCLSARLLSSSSHLLFPLFLSFSLAPPSFLGGALLRYALSPAVESLQRPPSPLRVSLRRRAGREEGARGRRRLWRRRLPPAGRCSPVGRSRPRLCRHRPAVPPLSLQNTPRAPGGAGGRAATHPKSHRRLSRPPRTATVIAGPRGHTHTHNTHTYADTKKAWHFSRSTTTNSKKTQQHMAPLITHHTQQQTHRTRTDPYQPRKRGEAALL